MNLIMIGRIHIAACVLLLLASCQQQEKSVFREIQSPSSPVGVYRVMTFNIRTGTADDGENSWPYRKDIVSDLLAEYAGDVMGMQEALDFQIKDIVRVLPEYFVVAAGRDDGKKQGEACPILYRKDRFKLTDSGTFWFSNSPWKPSMHWGNQYLRICTWVRLTERLGGNSFYVYNVHLDHQSQLSRQKSAELLAKEIFNRPTEDPYIVMGDFNMEMDNPAMLYLQKIGVQTPYPRLVDTWQMLYRAEKPAGTFNGFNRDLSGPNIDHILVRDDTEIIEVGIDRRSFNGRYPSDH
ncbi:MAG: endonuclease/exonuclease/phosphatase family protein, partial [Deltaproteobacteria bacterium]|nr:endonuclease/exonuclease/phosphatase family protein [Deltaproteobacteria bacterium]